MPSKKREYPDRPIIGVGGVIFDHSSVLLVKRNQEPGKGEWSLPGGAVELGETVVEALKRELREEASIEVEVFGLIRLLDRIVYDRNKRVRYHFVIADYWGEVVSGLPTPGSDISDLCFVPPNEVAKLGVHKDVKETILMAMAMRDQYSVS
ncbi:MAG: NUDIX hydrolase [Proteobacteria bacterium]|nr:NUDIX hydrolase [Pseudomonadota bacterium]